MKKLALLAGCTALLFGACSQGNGSNSADTQADSIAAVKPSSPIDSLLAKCEQLNETFPLQKKDGGIDSIKYFNETLTFYCNVPKGFLASKQNTDQLPATAIIDLKMLEQTALREIIATDTKVKFHYREQGEDGAIHNVTLSSQAVKKLYKTMKEPVKE